MTDRLEHGVLVVGGGPAGLASAIAAAQSGMQVAVLERSRPPIDKACGEGLMPDARAQLDALGVAIPHEHCMPFRGVRYIDGELAAEGEFLCGAGLGVRRLHLHAALVRRAEELGVDLRWGVTVRGFSETGVVTGAGDVRARWMVAADGLGSRTRRWSGLEGRAGSLRRFGIRRHYAIAPWSEFVEVYWSRGCEAYVTPVAAGCVGVAILWSGGKGRFDDLLCAFPSLRERLASAKASSRDQGAGPFHRRSRAVHRGRLALVGDAAGYLDPITGEGLAVAFHQASAVVRAIQAGDLRVYAAAHRHIVALPDFMTRLVLTLSTRPRLRRRVIAALASEGQVFHRLLTIHAGLLPVTAVGWGGLLRLALRTVVPGQRISQALPAGRL